jgi:WD40 repeat protein
MGSQPERVLDAPGMVDDYYTNLLEWTSRNVVAIALGEAVYAWNGDTGEASELCRGSEEESVTSLASSLSGLHLAVGTGEGTAQIWDIETQQKIRTMRCHSSRVGVLSWDKYILSTGCHDGSIFNHDVRVADHKVGEMIGHSAEVCGLAWRADGHQLASGGNDNTVNIWDARTSIPKFTKTNHTAAVKVTLKVVRSHVAANPP